MQITKLNTISDFVSPFPKIPHMCTNFWKWGALILAVVATFTSIITRIKLLIIRIRSIKPPPTPSHHLFQQVDGDFDCTTGHDDDASSSVTESDEEEIFESTYPSNNLTQNQFDQDFSVAGSSSKRENHRKSSDSFLRRRHCGGDSFLWSEFATGKSVVKLWDSLGVGKDVQDSSGSEISIWDLCMDQKISTFLRRGSQIPAVAISSPAVVCLAESSKNDGVVFAAYDKRMGGKNPAMHTEWGPLGGKVIGVSSGGVEKVYVNSGVAGGACTVGDMRNVKSTLGNFTGLDTALSHTLPLSLF